MGERVAVGCHVEASQGSSIYLGPPSGPYSKSVSWALNLVPCLPYRALMVWALNVYRGI